MPSCKGGGCSIVNPMMVEPSGDPDQDLFAPPEPPVPYNLQAEAGGRGSRDSSAFAGVGLPPPPPPVKLVAEYVGDPHQS